MDRPHAAKKFTSSLQSLLLSSSIFRNRRSGLMVWPALQLNPSAPALASSHCLPPVRKEMIRQFGKHLQDCPSLSQFLHSGMITSLMIASGLIIMAHMTRGFPEEGQRNRAASPSNMLTSGVPAMIGVVVHTRIAQRNLDLFC